MLRCLVYTVRYMLSESQYVIVYVILYVMLYVIVYVMLYNLLTWLNLKRVFSKSHVYVTHGIVYLIFASKFHLLS